MVDIGGRGRTPVGVNIYFHALGLSTIAEGKPYATVKAMVSLFGAFAELERSTIVDRLQSGRRVALEKGAFTPGRPSGSRMSDGKLLGFSFSKDYIPRPMPCFRLYSWEYTRLPTEMAGFPDRVRQRSR